MKNKAKKIRDFISAKKLLVSLWVLSVMNDLMLLPAYAADPTPTPAPAGTAEAKWDTVIGFIVPWITRLGGVVILIGAVEFGLAFKNDDAEGKTKGMRTIIAGCIVTAVGLSADIFLA